MQLDARFKSMFIFPAVGLSAALLLWSLFAAFRARHDSLAWWGAAVANLPFVLLFAAVFLSRAARTSENLPFYLMVTLFGAFATLWQVVVERVADWMPLAMAGAGSTLFLIYVFWYSRFGRLHSDRISVGSKLPEFALMNTEGRLFTSAELAGKPALLVFYRGNWCPFCMAQVREVAARYRDLEALGVKVLFISPQAEDRSQSLAERFDVPVEFLVDAKNELAQRLDIGIDNGVPTGVPGGYEGATVLPTVLAVNGAGTIVYSDQTDNYRVRPDPDVFLAILRRTEAIAR